MGDEVQVSSADGGGSPPGSRISPSDVPQFGCSDREGARQQGSCARVGIESSDHQSLGTDEEDKRSVARASYSRSLLTFGKGTGGVTFGHGGIFVRQAAG